MRSDIFAGLADAAVWVAFHSLSHAMMAQVMDESDLLRSVWVGCPEGKQK